VHKLSRHWSLSVGLFLLLAIGLVGCLGPLQEELPVQQPEEKGEPTSTELKEGEVIEMIRIRSVDKPDPLPYPDPQLLVQEGLRQIKSKSRKPLSALRGHPDLLVPTYLPTGFSPDHAFVLEPQRPHSPWVLHFRALPRAHGTLPSGFLTIFLFPKGTPLTPYQTQAGAVEEVSIRQHPGYFLRSAWTRVYDRGGSLRKEGWDENFVQLLLEWEGRRILLVGTPAQIFTKEELIKIAESLQPWK